MSSQRLAPETRSGDGLSELDLAVTYRTGPDRPLSDFYLPCLRRAVEYDRTTGYFDSKAFAHAADGLAAFVANGGRMRLVCSPRLRRGDVKALCGRVPVPALDLEAVRYGGDAREELAVLFRGDRRAATAWLVENDVLRVRVAFREHDGEPFAHYHEKLGVFAGPAGETVAFSGSVNETGLAWAGNVESLDVFRSWREGEDERVEAKKEAFEALWADETASIRVRPIDEALDDGIGWTHVWKTALSAVSGWVRG